MPRTFKKLGPSANKGERPVREMTGNAGKVAEIRGMTKPQLEAKAAEIGADISAATNNAGRADIIIAALGM